jgi:hypothetical protein
VRYSDLRVVLVVVVVVRSTSFQRWSKRMSVAKL